MSIGIIVGFWIISEFLIAYYQEVRDIEVTRKQKLIYSIIVAIIGTSIAVSTDVINMINK